MTKFLCIIGIYLIPHLSAAQYLLQGKVTDKNGRPIAGTSVKIKNTTVGVRTDSAGVFSLRINEEEPVLSVSHLGYESREVRCKIPLNEPLIVQLESNAFRLEEVEVSTGYQVLPKERATGAFDFIDKDKLNEQVATGILERLESVANGLSVDRSTVNGGMTVRGQSSLTGPKELLVVVDNFPYDGDINNINPNDVESITLLKDAAASSIWGTRAGNGVVVITTKRGGLNQPLAIEVNANVTFMDKPDLFYPKQLTPSQYIEVEQFLFDKGYRFADTASVRHVAFSPVYEILFKHRAGEMGDIEKKALLEQLGKQDLRRDYTDYIYRPAINQQYAINLSSGTDKSSWYFSMGYDRNISDLSAGYNRFNTSFRNTYRPVKALQINTGIYFTQMGSTNGKPVYGTVRMGNYVLPPYTALANSAGEALSVTRFYRQQYLDTVGGGRLLDWNYYLLDDYRHTDLDSRLTDILLNFDADYKVLPWLGLVLRYQYEQQTGTEDMLYGRDSYFTRDMINKFTHIDPISGNIDHHVPLGAILDAGRNKMAAHNLRAQLNMDKLWGRHRLHAVLGGEAKERTATGDHVRIYGYNPDILTFANVDFTGPYRNITNGINEFIPNNTYFTHANNRFLSAFANAAYTLAGKYTLSLSGRRDASNLFGVNTNDKWNLLWSAGVAWNLSEERFYRSELIPYLKMRFTHGFSGNVDLGRSAVTTISYRVGPLASSPYTLGPMATISQHANPDLRWEKVGMTNLAADFGLKGNRLNGSIDFYRKYATDLFGPDPMDYTTGISGTVVRNVASFKGRGVDLRLNSFNLNGPINWTSELNFTFYRDKYVDYYKNSLRGRDYITGVTPNLSGFVGKPLYGVYSYQWRGLDGATGEPIGVINGRDSKNYGAIVGDSTTVHDLVYSGPALPTAFGSLGNTFGWKNFSVTVRVLFKLGYYYRRNAIHYYNLFSSGSGGHPEYAHRWQQPGDEQFTDVPAMLYPAMANRDNLYANSDVTVERGDHIRLQYVSMSYRLDRKLVTRMGIKSLEFYMNANNLGILWRANKENIDPEYRSANAVPPAKSISLGLRMNL
ncbi:MULTISPECIES: SusC/RagA family TonB-linked outer membrane protein [Olivibacter]|uniref:SusC/RagA family TonB-linked outer membrane protein n=1 Tax=Olivibacter jilunii TaxID=985016 RepID=A0ABW6B7X1_9SPHI